jgi:hypothetical protein
VKLHNVDGEQLMTFPCKAVGSPITTAELEISGWPSVNTTVYVETAPI